MAFEIPNLRHLRVFLEVAGSKSISKASDRVFLSQPAITQAIAKLEARLATSLFERRSDGMYPTQTGRVFQNRVKRAMDEVLQGVKEAVRLGAGKKNLAPSHLVQLLTTTQLRALIAVSEAQNFSIASRNLGISQSSLHRAARELEHLLKVGLFEKTSLGINSTKAAQALAKASKLAFAEIWQGFDEVASLHNREVGRIVVGGMPLARTSILPTAINTFAKDYPDFRINVVDGPYNDLLLHLRNGDIDLLIGALRIPAVCDDIEQETLFSPPLAVISRPNHPLLKETKVGIEQLASYPWVVPRQGTPTRAAFEVMFTDADCPVPTRLVESSSQILIRELLLGSDRLTLISAHQMQHEESQGLLASIPFDLNHTCRPVGLTLRRNWQPTSTQAVFVELLRQQGRKAAAES